MTNLKEYFLFKDSNWLIVQSFFLDIALWLPWVPLTYSFKGSVHNTILAAIFSSLLFLSPRIFRWLALGRVGRLLDTTDSKLNVLLGGVIVLAIYLFISSIIRMPLIDFIFVGFRGIIQAIFDCSRPILLKSNLENELVSRDTEFVQNKIKQKTFELSLIPSLAMGIGSLIGGLLSNTLDLSEIFLISFGLTIVILFPTLFRYRTDLNIKELPLSKNKTYNLNALPVASLDIRKGFSERFAIATGFGGTPFLMHLKFDSFNGSEQFNFSLFMCAISIGVLLAFILPKKVVALSKPQNAGFFFIVAWVTQFSLLYLETGKLSIVALSIATVFFQFLFMGISISNLVKVSPDLYLGTILSLASKYEISGAIVAHLIYGLSISYISPIQAYLVSSLIAVFGGVAIYYRYDLQLKKESLNDEVRF